MGVDSAPLLLPASRPSPPWAGGSTALEAGPPSLSVAAAAAARQRRRPVFWAACLGRRDGRHPGHVLAAVCERPPTPLAASALDIKAARRAGPGSHRRTVCRLAMLQQQYKGAGSRPATLHGCSRGMGARSALSHPPRPAPALYPAIVIHCKHCTASTPTPAPAPATLPAPTLHQCTRRRPLTVMGDDEYEAASTSSGSDSPQVRLRSGAGPHQISRGPRRAHLLRVGSPKTLRGLAAAGRGPGGRQGRVLSRVCVRRTSRRPPRASAGSGGECAACCALAEHPARLQPCPRCRARTWGWGCVAPPRHLRRSWCPPLPALVPSACSWQVLPFRLITQHTNQCLLLTSGAPLPACPQDPQHGGASSRSPRESLDLDLPLSGGAKGTGPRLFCGHVPKVRG